MVSRWCKHDILKSLTTSSVGIVSWARGCLSSVAWKFSLEGEEREPSEPKHGWQKFASTTVQGTPQRGCRVARVGQIRAGVVAVSEWPRGRGFCPLCVNASEPSVPGGFSTFPRASPPSSFAFAISVRSCRCGRPLDVFGHHHAACNSRRAEGDSLWKVQTDLSRRRPTVGGHTRVHFIKIHP